MDRRRFCATPAPLPASDANTGGALGAGFAAGGAGGCPSVLESPPSESPSAPTVTGSAAAATSEGPSGDGATASLASRPLLTGSAVGPRNGLRGGLASCSGSDDPAQSGNAASPKPYAQVLLEEAVEMRMLVPADEHVLQALSPKPSGPA